MQMYGLIKKKKREYPIVAGMPTNNPKDMKLRTVGFRVMELTFDVNPRNKYDEVLISEKEIMRVFY